MSNAERCAFATAALTVRYGERTEGQPLAPITAEQLDSPRRIEDQGDSLWLTFQRVQENSLHADFLAAVRRAGAFAREVGSIDRSVGLNRAPVGLGQEMKKLKA
jgi:hypothetical protein